ncbi:MAG: hypothetical protein V4663_05955 [Bacteroidota bacterium]
MTYDILRNGAIVATVHPEGKQQVAAMGKNTLSMSFKLPLKADIKVKDYVILDGERYNINRCISDEKTAKRDITYNLEFEHEFYDLKKVKLKSFNPQNALLELNFSLVANAVTLLNLIVENMNVDYEGWLMGTCIATETKLFTFNNQNCLQVLHQIATEYQTEFWFDGKTIHIYKREIASDITLSQGMGNGLLNIRRQARNNVDIVTKLFVKGSTQNLPAGYRDNVGYLMMTGGASFIMDQEKVDEYGVIEDEITFDIKPERQGTVTDVIAGDGNWKYFFDNTIDFDINDCKLPGLPIKVSFLSGQLGGFTFTISAYDHDLRRFTINRNDEEKSFDIPSDLLRPELGDDYVLLDLELPAAYVTDGEQRVTERGVEFYVANNDPNKLVDYSAKADRFFIKENNITVVLGMVARLLEPDLDLDKVVRISSYTRDLQDRYLYDDVQWSERITTDELIRQIAEQTRVFRAIENTDILNPESIRKTTWLSRLSEKGGYIMIGDEKANAGNSDQWNGMSFIGHIPTPVKGITMDADGKAGYTNLAEMQTWLGIGSGSGLDVYTKTESDDRFSRKLKVVFATPMAIWEINHEASEKVTVKVYNNANKEVFADVHLASNVKTQIFFSSPQTGYVIINF